MAQRIRHLTTDQGIPGSNPGRIDVIIFTICFALFRPELGNQYFSNEPEVNSSTVSVILKGNVSIFLFNNFTGMILYQQYNSYYYYYYYFTFGA